MNNYLLFEVGVEELPSRFVSSTLDQIKSNLTKMFNENRIEFSDIKTYGTPRRLTFIVENISERQSNLEEEVKGPSKKIALDADGNFTKPALGFMKSKGLKEEDVVFKTVGKDEYIFGTIRQEGKETSEVLKTILPEAVKNVTFPKAMRWGGRNMRFARPIRWMVTLLNDNVLEIDLEGIKSSNITKGHRFLGQSEFEVNSLEDYLTKLEENFVILDQDKRKEMIRKQCIEVAKSLGGEVEFDEDLLEDVLVENRQAVEMATIYGDILSRIMDAFSAIISNNQNGVMQFLTSVTLITTIPTIVSGFFGMNVGGIPYANDVNGFWIVMLITTLICLVITFFMSRNKLL